MILLIDNYDSFSYNLYQLVGEHYSDIKVVRNDELTVKEIEALSPKLIIISPGPGKPSEAGNIIEVIKELAGKIPIFGVCLGHQAICEAFGATVSYAKSVMHGKRDTVKLETSSDLFNGLPSEISVARYHSLIAYRNTLPSLLKVTAEAFSQDSLGEVMAVENREKKLYGVQFHPESVMTPDGKNIILNLLRSVGL